MGEEGGAVCGSMLGEIYGDIAQLVLFATVRAKAAVVQDLYPRALKVDQDIYAELR